MVCIFLVFFPLFFHKLHLKLTCFVYGIFRIFSSFFLAFLIIFILFQIVILYGNVIYCFRIYYFILLC